MAVTGVFSNTTLTFVGDLNPNVITVSRDAGGAIFGNGGAIVVSGGPPTVATTALVEVIGDGGNDTILLDETIGALPRGNLFGGAGNDSITGGSGGDLLWGDIGNDILVGRGGTDFLTGGDGNDTLTGGDGDDQVFGGAGDDLMIWNPGDDTDLFEGGADIDTAQVNGGNGAEQFFVSANGARVRFDRITPAPFAIDMGGMEILRLNMGGGDDTFSTGGSLAALIKVVVDGGSGEDAITGGDGADILIGGADEDNISGGTGNDTLFGGTEADTLTGGADNDTYVLGAEGSGVDNVIDSAGIDTITSTINRSLSFADYSEIENLTLLSGTTGVGNALANTITGNALANILNGTTGIDRLVGGGGSDTHYVDATIDTVIEAAGAAGGAADRVIFTGLANQTYLLAANVENLILGGATATRANGNLLANTMTGNVAANVLDGKQGNDTLLGGNGNDTLTGGVGIDRLGGGANNDIFVFAAPVTVANRDVITDFNAAQDIFRLENLYMPALGGPGGLNGARFFAGAAAHDADDRIIYNRATGALVYDSNGNAAGGATLIATLLNKPVLTAADFAVI